MEISSHLAFNTRQPFKPCEGPTITTGIVYQRVDAGFKNWFILQEGGYPREIGAILQLLNPHRDLFREVEILTPDTIHNICRAASAGKIGALDPNTDTTAIFLAIGRDLANGVIGLHPLTDELKITWDVPSNLRLYDAERRLAADIAKEMG